MNILTKEPTMMAHGTMNGENKTLFLHHPYRILPTLSLTTTQRRYPLNRFLLSPIAHAIRLTRFLPQWRHVMTYG